jgi:choline dehydrogenase-like flavoprotein
MFQSVGTLKRLVQGVRQKAVGDFVKHLGAMITDIDGVAVAVYGKLAKGHFPVKMIRLDNQGEVAPNPESRITLSPERDGLGKSRARLQWRLSALDKHSLRRTHEILGQELGRAGLGRLQIELDEDDTVWPPNLTAGHHHMGTTRMHVDPKQGVVDSNCRVHDMENLFIAGSSVFPTSGGVNPTLTIVALAIRLADHVKGLMQ